MLQLLTVTLITTCVRSEKQVTIITYHSLLLWLLLVIDFERQSTGGPRSQWTRILNQKRIDVVLMCKQRNKWSPAVCNRQQVLITAQSGFEKSDCQLEFLNINWRDKNNHVQSIAQMKQSSTDGHENGETEINETAYNPEQARTQEVRPTADPD